MAIAHYSDINSALSILWPMGEHRGAAANIANHLLPHWVARSKGALSPGGITLRTIAHTNIIR